MATSTFDNLEGLCNKLLAEIQTLRSVDKDNDLLARRKATDIARELLNELIHPEEVAAEQAIALSEWASIRMYMKWKFFDKIPLDGSVSYHDLATSIGAEEALVCTLIHFYLTHSWPTNLSARMGQMLVSTGKLLQPVPNHVAHSRLSVSYRTGDSIGASFAMHHDDFQSVGSSLPAYFDKYGPRLPRGKTHVPFCFPSGFAGQLTTWEVLARQGKEHIEQFGYAMQAMPNYAWPFTGAYDFTWVEEYAAAVPERPLIIDVGGSYGHALRANLVKFPGIPPGRCVVEDRLEMIPSITEEHENDSIMKDVQKVATDFHMEQPIKGALIYFIRRCIHDYDDDDCVEILKILADSLPDDEPRARILINEQIVTDPPHRWVAAMDIIMMTFASAERSEEQFRSLAGRASLDVVKIHKAEGATSMYLLSLLLPFSFCPVLE
ncbi:S-adenosyl-L-methionine-dependent methyltransferase [Hypoxylon crocopeplum]|nr:S-adenosyl-L-methionine-dependent methyltransferase [Hypoxylon crocopeplum]